jgi:hypothetical protein
MSIPFAAVGRALRYAGFDAVREFVARNYHSLRSSLDPDPVLDADWDLLVVLDACRADLYETVVAEGEYDGLEAGETRISPGSSTTEWLRAVFGTASDGVVGSIGYVSGNPYTGRLLDPERFGVLEEVWRYAWDDELGTIRPRNVTDRAIAVGREHDVDRLVVHYMQPHFPSVVDPQDGGVSLATFGDEQMAVWKDLRYGWRDVPSVWEHYRRNLEVVLGEVEVLLTNVDADRAVVTADHGNAFGEKHIYGHPSSVDLPCLREVPWCVTTATDYGAHQPAIRENPSETETPDDPIDDRLRSLGYSQ